MARRTKTLACTPWDALLDVPLPRLPHGCDVALVLAGKRCETQEQVRAARQAPDELLQGSTDELLKAAQQERAEVTALCKHLRQARRACTNAKYARSPEALANAAARRQSPEYLAYKAQWQERNREAMREYRSNYDRRRKALDPAFREKEAQRARKSTATKAAAAAREGGAA